MALPRTLANTAFPIQNYFCGPWRDANGNDYILTLNSSALDEIEVHKADDGDAVWAEVDGGNHPNLGSNVVSMWGYQDGTQIKLITQTADFDVEYHSFGMSDDGGSADVWITTAESVEVSIDVLGGEEHCSLVIRSDNDRVAVYSGDRENIKGTKFGRVKYNLWEGTSWAGPVAVDDGGSVEYMASSVVLGASDKSHIFFKDETNSDILHKSLTSGNSLSSVETVNDTTVTPSDMPLGPGVFYDDAGTERITIGWVDSSGSDLYTSEIDADGVPGAEEQVSADDVKFTGPQRVFCLAVDTATDTVYAVWSNASQGDDIYIDENVDSGGWGTDVEVLDAVTCNDISANVYVRDDTSTVVAILFDDGGTVKYTEHVVVTGVQDIAPNSITSDESVPSPLLTLFIDLVGNGIAGAEAFGTAILDMNIDLASNAIGSDESIGVAVLTTGVVDISPTAITSDESVPSPQVNMHIDLVGNGITSDESVPSPVLDMSIDLTGNGITSDESVPSPQLDMNIDLAGNAIGSDEAVGSPSVSATISPTGITSDESVPSPQLNMNIDLTGNGITSDESVPGPLVELELQFITLTTGIASAESVGSPQVDLIIDVTGIPSDESVPSPQVDMNVDLIGNGITSDESLPSPQVDMNIDLIGDGITSDESVPNPVLTAGAVDIAPNAIGSDESIGSHTLTPGPVDIAPTAIASVENVPSPQVNFIIFPVSVITEEAFGTAVLTTGAVDISPPSIASAEAVGGHLVTLGGPADVGGRSSLFNIYRLPRIPKI